MALEITYKGTQIAQLTTNGNLTLETAGKYCEGNIGIAYTGGGGFNTNSAILKVITSTNCTILVTGTNYSETHQQANGFPRSSDANVTEHFFSIPTTAFGTITVTATNTYGNNTKTITVDTAGKIYEVLCGGTNIILNDTFGLQNGYYINTSYFSLNDENHIKGLSNGGNYVPIFKDNDNEFIVPVSAYTRITCTARTPYNSQSQILLVDEGSRQIALINGYNNNSNYQTLYADITNKRYSVASLRCNDVFFDITEIILT